MNTNFLATQLIEFVVLRTCTRIRKRIDIGRKLFQLQTSVPTFSPKITSCNRILLFAICHLIIFFADRCDAIVVVQPYKTTRSVAFKLTLRYNIVTRKHTNAIILMSSRNDSVENGGLTQSQQEQASRLDSGSMTGDFAVIGTNSNDESSYTFPQQQPNRNRLADRIRQLHQQQQSIDDDVATTSSSQLPTTTMTESNTDDKNELYLQVKQGIVQIKSKEQHTYVLLQICAENTCCNRSFQLKFFTTDIFN